MRFMMILLGLFLAWIVIAKADYSPESASEWTGQSVDSLLNSWGSPDIKINRNNGNKVLIYYVKRYRSYDQQWSPSIGVNVNGGRPAIIATPNPNPYNPHLENTLTCTVKFEVNSRGTIIGTTMQGNGCDNGYMRP